MQCSKTIFLVLSVFVSPIYAEKKCIRGVLSHKSFSFPEDKYIKENKIVHGSF